MKQVYATMKTTYTGDKIFNETICLYAEHDDAVDRLKAMHGTKEQAAKTRSHMTVGPCAKFSGEFDVLDDRDGSVAEYSVRTLIVNK